MTLNDTHLEFSSTWDIDQLIASGTVAVGSGDTALYTIADATKPNVTEVQFKPTGDSYYYQAGISSSNATLAGLFSFYPYITGTSLHIVTSSAGTARYYIWSDKGNY